MSFSIRIHETGEPEVLIWEEGMVGDPGPKEARIRHTAVGVNFIDVYQRTGLYQVQVPFVPGQEGAGVVVAVGSEVTNVSPGDRVAYSSVMGAYCEERLIAADRLVKIPDGIDNAVAAGVMLKGLTAEYLLRRTFPVRPGHTILFHAAAGGVGLIACQWAKALGATVIGTAGSAEKLALAKDHGCDHVIDYTSEDFVARVDEITNGRGVDVVYDSVGKDTFPGSLDALAKRGMWVTFGQSSGPLPDFSPLLLMKKGSVYATRPTLIDYIGTREELEAAAKALFDAILAGHVRPTINQTFALRDAAAAHRALEGRTTTGSTVLIP